MNENEIYFIAKATVQSYSYFMRAVELTYRRGWASRFYGRESANQNTFGDHKKVLSSKRRDCCSDLSVNV